MLWGGRNKLPQIKNIPKDDENVEIENVNIVPDTLSEGKIRKNSRGIHPNRRIIEVMKGVCNYQEKG